MTNSVDCALLAVLFEVGFARYPAPAVVLGIIQCLVGTLNKAFKLLSLPVLRYPDGYVDLAHGLAGVFAFPTHVLKIGAYFIRQGRCTM